MRIMLPFVKYRHCICAFNNKFHFLWNVSKKALFLGYYNNYVFYNLLSKLIIQYYTYKFTLRKL